MFEAQRDLNSVSEMEIKLRDSERHEYVGSGFSEETVLGLEPAQWRRRSEASRRLETEYWL